MDAFVYLSRCWKILGSWTNEIYFSNHSKYLLFLALQYVIPLIFKIKQILFFLFKIYFIAYILHPDGRIYWYANICIRPYKPTKSTRGKYHWNLSKPLLNLLFFQKRYFHTSHVRTLALFHWLIVVGDEGLNSKYFPVFPIHRYELGNFPNSPFCPRHISFSIRLFKFRDVDFFRNYNGKKWSPPRILEETLVFDGNVSFGGAGSRCEMTGAWGRRDECFVGLIQGSTTFVGRMNCNILFR